MHSPVNPHPIIQSILEAHGAPPAEEEMSLEAFGDEPWDVPITEDDVENAFRSGAQACREMLARFVEQGGDNTTAQSIRLNWCPSWGDDPGPLEGDIPLDAFGTTQSLIDRGREHAMDALRKARGDQ